MKTPLIALIPLLLLCSCATTIPDPSPQELASADYGELPQEGTLDYLKGYLGANLKDPYSAVFKFSYEKGRKVINGRNVWGYVVYPTLNAKNSFGGYTGEHSTTPCFARTEHDLKESLVCVGTDCYQR